MPEKNKDLEKKPDLGSGPGPEKKEDLKESFSNLKNELNELKSNIKEGQEDKKDSQTLDKLDKEISNIDKTIEAEKTLEKKTGGEGKIATKKEYKIAKQINDWLLTNPGEANQIRAESALKLLEDIHGQLDTNRIAKGAQWIMQKLTKNS